MTDIVLSSTDCKGIHGDIVAILESSRRAAARSVNALMTATYREVGWRVVEFEQGGENRPAYGQALLIRAYRNFSFQSVPCRVQRAQFDGIREGCVQSLPDTVSGVAIYVTVSGYRATGAWLRGAPTCQ